VALGGPFAVARLSADVIAPLVASVALAAVLLAVFVMRSGRRHTPRPAKRGRTSIPARAASSRGGSSIEWRPSGNGQAIPSAGLRMKGAGDQEYELGLEPAVIGSSSEICTIVLTGDGIAPEHARVWYRQGRFLLHHVGGLSRKTYVSGQEADWVVLESGDEVAIGPHRLIFDDRGAVAAPAPVEEIHLPSKRDAVYDDDLSKMEAAVRELWAEAQPASETAVGERSGTGKYKVHRKKDELAKRVGGQWVKRGRTVVLER
jgi:hypothetical protein